MNIKHIPEKALRKIIANNYLGEHDKKGKQVDYGDYIDEINQRLWELSDRRIMSKFTSEDAPEAEIEPFELPPISPEHYMPKVAQNGAEGLRMGFKLGIRWDLIAINCERLTL